MTEQINTSYIIDILQLLKNLAFQQLLMQKFRQQLCDDQHFDPFTAFKFVDSFKHNMIIGVELKSFLQLGGHEITIFEAEQVIKALNKSQDSLNYDRFLEMLMPYNVKKKNLSLTRYNRMEVSIGTYSLINQVKNRSRQQITKFFVKELQFCRKFMSQRQDFCRKWGGDIYTITQQLFKGNNEQLNTSTKNPLFQYTNKKDQTILPQLGQLQIDFNNFCQFGRKYKGYFNQQQFKGIWRRIKCIQQKLILRAEQIFIKRDDLVNILLVNNFNTKLKYASQYMIPLKSLQTLKPPSYKQPIPQQKIHNSWAYNQQRQKEQFQAKLCRLKRQINDPLSLKMKQQYSYPQIQRNCVSVKLRQKQQQWKQVIQTMTPTMIDQRYYQILNQDRQRYYR